MTSPDYDNVPLVLMMRAAAHRRIASLDHVALLPSELDRADLVAIRDVVVPDGARELYRPVACLSEFSNSVL